ncbi:MAG: YggT family protein [Chloroflexi bacterium]|nr:YggT family protein [Chloroflexota bacterium]
MNNIVGLFIFAVNLYTFILIARALISWFRVDPYSPIVRFLHDATEPVLAPIRSVVPPMGGLDLSILIAFILLFIIQSILQQLLLVV